MKDVYVWVHETPLQMQMSRYRSQVLGRKPYGDVQAKMDNLPLTDNEARLLIPESKVKVQPLGWMNWRMKIGILEIY